MDKIQSKKSLTNRRKSKMVINSGNTSFSMKSRKTNQTNSDMDPLKELMNNADIKKKVGAAANNDTILSYKQNEKGGVLNNKTAANKDNKPKLYVGQTTVRVVKRQQVSILAQAMRQYFIKSLKRFLANGQLKSKYFYKFEIIDIISPKCYVISPKSRSVQSNSQTHQKFIFKQLQNSSIEIFCGTINPTPAQVNSIIDPWINLVPKTPYIATAYEVYSDYSRYMQMTEYCDGYDNVFNRLKKTKFGLLQESIPRQLIRMTYLFVIQISHAFSFAHAGNLTHGAFDLTQTLLDGTLTQFKIINFRPWLALGKPYELLQYCDNPSFRNLTNIQKQKIAKSRDLFTFGEALYDLMLNKTSKEEQAEQQVNLRGDSNDQSLATQENMSKMTQESEHWKKSATKGQNNKLEQNSKTSEVNIMPVMETIPLAWVQITEGAQIIDILHMCMTIDTERDTVALFNHINRLATEQYQKFFDSAYKPLALASRISEEFLVYFRVASLNNRAIMTQFKIMSHQLGKQVSELDNQVVLDYQEKLFLHCVQMDPFCEETNINYILLLWRRGKIMDDRVCDEIWLRIEDRPTAQLLIHAFRKANRYQVDPTFDTGIMKLVPSEGISIRIHHQIKHMQEEALIYPQAPSTMSRKNNPFNLGQLSSMQMHVTQAIPGAGTMSGANSAADSPHHQGDQKEGPKMCDIKRICFSKNERFMLLITSTQAVVYSVLPGKFEVINQIELPQQVDYKTCDRQTLRSLAKEWAQPSTIDILQATLGSHQQEDQQMNQAAPAIQIDAEVPNGKTNLQIQVQQSQHQQPQTPGGSPTKGGKRSLSIASPLGLDQSLDKLDASDDRLSAESESQDGDDAQQSQDEIRIRRRTPLDKPGNETQDELEQRHLQREKETIGGGFMNSEWIGAIDNTGEILCLHSSESVQLIPKIRDGDESSNFSRDQHSRSIQQNLVNDSVHEDVQVMQLVSDLHVYSGTKYTTYNKFQIGHICPDEILDLELDNVQEDIQNMYSLADSNTVMHPSQMSLNVDNQKTGQPISPITKFSQDKKSTFKKAIQDDSPKFGQLPEWKNIDHNESSSPNKMMIGNNARLLLTEHPKMPQNLSVEEMSIGRNSVIDEQDLTSIPPRLQSGGVYSSEEINNMQLGSVMLEDNRNSSIFKTRNNSLERLAAVKYGMDKQINVKCKNMKSYDLCFATDRTQQKEDIPSVILLREPTVLPGGATIPTALFRDPEVMRSTQQQRGDTPGPRADNSSINNYKSLHYEHMREWIQKQEQVGNIIKFSLLDSKYCIGFQRTNYRGLKPHFFVYEILKRQVVRRFLPLIDQFKQEWASFDAAAAYIEANINPADDDSDLDNSTDQQDQEEFAEDVNVFQVSPQGSYLVALVSQEFLVLKMLPSSMNQTFRKILTPSFMIQEHLFQPATINDTYLDEQPDSGDKNDEKKMGVKQQQNQDGEIYVMTDPKKNSSQGSLDEFHTIAEQLTNAYSNYEDFVGSTYYKHALKDTNALIYPQVQQFDVNSAASEQNAIDSEDSAGEFALRENSQILPKQLRKVLQAIKEYNYSYSVMTPHTQMLSGNIVTSNHFSKKVGVLSLKKLCVFDQFIFGRPDDKIKQILFSSYPRNWRVAVFFRRQLQVYDQITGQQIFELVCPSARKIAFIDGENLIAVLEGQSQVFICAVNSQRQAFLNRELQVRRGDALQVQEYEENQRYSQYTIGISVQRQDQQNRGKYSDQSENSDVEDETIGIKVIVFDEVIKQMVTSRNVSPFGYLALIGDTKMSIYLTYAEEDTCTYDHVWTINFMDMRKNQIGKRIELIDFAPNCEEFIAVTNTGDLTLWSLKKTKYIRKIITLKAMKQTPITHLRSYKNNQHCVAFSQPNNLILLIDMQGLSENHLNKSQKIQQIRPESEGFGKLLNFQLDISEQFLICTFNNDKVGIYTTGPDVHLALFCDEPNMCCQDAFIDETGCFISMLDETRTKTNIYVIEWNYEVEAPPERKRRHSTLESFGDPSEIGHAGSNKGLESMRTGSSKKLLDSVKDKNQVAKATTSYNQPQNKLLSAKERKRLVLESRKLKLKKDLSMAKSQNEKSKFCSIF